MSLKIAAQVGPTSPNYGDGVPADLRAGKTGELIVSELNAPLYEQAVRRNLFTAYAAAVATSLVGTAMVGLQVWNGSPLTGGVNLVLLEVGGMVVVTSASLTSVVLATGTGQVSAPTSQTAITRVTNNFIGGQAPIATATNLGTFTNAPTAMKNLMHNTAAIGTTGEDPGFLVDLKGGIIIPPQCYVAIATVGAAAAASGMNLHLSWAEIPA